MQNLRDELLTNGYCLLPNVLKKHLIDKVNDHVENKFEQYIYSLRMQGKSTDSAFQEIKERGEGRFDFTLSNLAQFLQKESAWEEMLHSVFGCPPKLVYEGCLISFPGSKTQEWHQDGAHLSKTKHLSPRLVNFFIPLIQMIQSHGPTELVPGSHILKSKIDKTLAVSPLPRLGDALLFDYRILHRGLGNKSQETRPLLYLVYAVPGVRDIYNFSSQLPKLKLLDLPISREERLQNRRKRQK
jgi:ectoine hydroxylase-related dioxygenase (phytanoyl-CoA dioxygenase family)